MMGIQKTQTENETHSLASKKDSWNLAHSESPIVYFADVFHTGAHLLFLDESVYCAGSSSTGVCDSLASTPCVFASTACVGGDPRHLDGTRRGTEGLHLHPKQNIQNGTTA
ncbi:Hypothetical predicted protein [Scomber scombrus]|uniref:Uncharacterized protein n=1 Tax=Scomber scombrus TaxID=13677 RepID=A0AAV1NJ62_SCOSC